MDSGECRHEIQTRYQSKTVCQRHKVSLLLHELKGFILLPREINGLEKAK